MSKQKESCIGKACSLTQNLCFSLPTIPLQPDHFTSLLSQAFTDMEHMMHCRSRREVKLRQLPQNTQQESGRASDQVNTLWLHTVWGQSEDFGKRRTVSVNYDTWGVQSFWEPEHQMGRCFRATCAQPSLLKWHHLLIGKESISITATKLCNRSQRKKEKRSGGWKLKTRLCTISLHRKYLVTILSMNPINIHFVLQYPGPSLLLKHKPASKAAHTWIYPNKPNQTSALSPHRVQALLLGRAAEEIRIAIHGVSLLFLATY